MPHSWLERHRHEHAVAEWRSADAEWTAAEGRLEELAGMAQDFQGITRADDPSVALELRTGERAFYQARGAALIEPRHLPGTWQGGYSGFSFPIARGVRWRVGGSRGHYVQGPEVPTPIDTGIVTITDQRIVFQGSKQSREWLFSKLLGYQHASDLPWTAVQVSNRQKVSGILYDPEHAEDFHFRLALALARYHHDVPGFVAELQSQVEEHKRARPVPPPPLSG